MSGEKDLSICSSGQNKLVFTVHNLDDPDQKFEFSRKGFELLGTCNDDKAFSSPNLKGKEVILESSCSDDRWIPRDFLQLSRNKGISSKREIGDEAGVQREEARDKKAKMEPCDLSLALPDVLRPLQNGDPLLQSMAISNNDNVTQTTFSNDFTLASISCPYSHAFSHNPSCSLTLNSAENCDYSVGSYKRGNDQIWHCGEGTNGSVHSRFRPVAGDGIALSVQAFVNGVSPSLNKDLSNSLYKGATSDNTLSFPSELPAGPHFGSLSGDSRGRPFDHSRVSGAFDERAGLNLSRPAKVVLQCVSESIPMMYQILQELPDETIELAKDYLRDLITAPESKDELAALQRKLERRSDLTKETLARSHRLHLDILVAIKFGLSDFVSQKLLVPTSELVEIFLLIRCRNVSCKSLLPVDDCECNICTAKYGFCSQCMCPVCLKFDCASNTCSWVGCDMCSHWCHATCGIEKNLIRPGPSLKGPSGTSGMQFYCVGCGYASEMLGFVKDVFVYCAKDWGVKDLIKELDCVRKIFNRSDDVKGKALYLKAQETIYRLEREVMSPSEACNLFLRFFNSAGKRWPSLATAAPKDAMPGKLAPTKKTLTLASSNPHSPSTGRVPRDMLPCDDHHQSAVKSSSLASDMIRDPTPGKSSMKNDGFDSLQDIVRIKEAEAGMYQIRADEAQEEGEGYRQLGRLRLERLEEEYTGKLANLCLQEAQERRRKKLEELKALERAHCDYYNMKVRMQDEIAGLLERMDATKHKWV